MGDRPLGPDYTLRRPVDVHQPLPIIFHENDEDIGGYFIQEDGAATKHHTNAPKFKGDVPTPVVSIVEDDVEIQKFPRPNTLMTSSHCDADVGQVVEYDLDSDDEDFVEVISELVPPSKTGARALTNEILESYIDFFEKNYFFTKAASKLPVKAVLLRKRARHKCDICDFSDPEQPVLECHSCGIMVHSRCYHDLLYKSSLVSGGFESSNFSREPPATFHKHSPAPTSASQRPKSSTTTKIDSTTHRGNSKNISRSKEAEESESKLSRSDELIGLIAEQMDTNVEDAYDPPYVDLLSETGTWCCAKCNSDEISHAKCELCNHSSGVLIPKGHPHDDLHDDETTTNAEDELGSTNSVNRPVSTKTSKHHHHHPSHHSKSLDMKKRKGRRKIHGGSDETSESDILWFHSICARSNASEYNKAIKKQEEAYLKNMEQANGSHKMKTSTNTEETEVEEDKSTIKGTRPISSSTTPTDKSKSPSKPSTTKTAKKSSSNATESNSSSSRNDSVKKTAASKKSATPSKAPAKANTKTPKLSLSNLASIFPCRLCGSKHGFVVRCSETKCSHHFHAHCAEKFCLLIEREYEFRFYCRIHSFPDVQISEENAEDYESSTSLYPLLERLTKSELEALDHELRYHDSAIQHGRSIVPVLTDKTNDPTSMSSPSKPTPQKNALVATPITPTKNTKQVKTVPKSATKSNAVYYPSFAQTRPLLLPLDGHIREYIFNYWLMKRVAVGHELIHRLRVLKQDETRKLEHLQTINAMEDQLKQMIKLRQHLERIRILVDLCKKRESLKKQRVDDMRDLFNLPGLIEHVKKMAGISSNINGRPSKKEITHSTPKSIGQNKNSMEIDEDSDTESSIQAPPAKARKLVSNSTPHGTLNSTSSSNSSSSSNPSITSSSTTSIRNTPVAVKSVQNNFGTSKSTTTTPIKAKHTTAVAAAATPKPVPSSKLPTPKQPVQALTSTPSKNTRSASHQHTASPSRPSENLRRSHKLSSNDASDSESMVVDIEAVSPKANSPPKTSPTKSTSTSPSKKTIATSRTSTVDDSPPSKNLRYSMQNETGAGFGKHTPIKSSHHGLLTNNGSPSQIRSSATRRASPARYGQPGFPDDENRFCVIS